MTDTDPTSEYVRLRTEFEAACKSEKLLKQRVAGLEAALRAAEEKANSYRIEADCAMRDYDGLDNEFGLVCEALQAIADGRPNKSFDPWTRDLARKTLAGLRKTETEETAYKNSTAEFTGNLGTGLREVPVSHVHAFGHKIGGDNLCECGMKLSEYSLWGDK